MPGSLPSPEHFTRNPDDLAQLIRAGLPAGSVSALAERLHLGNGVLIGDAEKAIEWLDTPNRALGGERPLERLDTDTGTRVVEDILGRIAYGVYS